MLTGLHPNRHGLPSNTFFDREVGKVRYCLEDDDPGTLVLGGTDRRSPRNILMGGQQPDGVYWFDRSQGRFTTSSKTLPSYVKACPKDGFMASLPMEWTHPTGRLRPDDYEGEDPRLNRISGHPAFFVSISLYGFGDRPRDASARGKRLGSRDALDVLAVGLSPTRLGTYGPSSDGTPI